MVLDTKRESVDPILSIFANSLKRVNPDVITWISLLFALFAGIFFYLSNPLDELSNYFLFFAAFFIFLNGLFDAIDGKIAKITNKLSKKGDFLDHSLDRFGDVLILGGLALSSWTRYPSIGLLAMVGMLLTSYMGTQSQAIGYKRNYTGLLGRADRLVLLMIAPIIQHILIYYNFNLLFNFYLLEWVLIYFGIVGIITAVQRFYITLRWLKK